MTPASTIRELVSCHYGLADMPMRVLTRQEEIAEFERNHPEVPPPLWEFVNHDVRLIRIWAKIELCTDLVVWDPTSQSYRLVQDLCFVDAYPTVAAWHQAIFELIRSSKDVWVVIHD